MERLSDTQKQALRYLVKAVNDKAIPEEFRIQWTDAGVAKIVSEGVTITVPPLTRLTAKLLTDEDLLYSDVTIVTGTTSGRQLPREDHRTCVITPAGFRAVDSDFAPVKDVNVHRPPGAITKSLLRFRTRGQTLNIQFNFRQ